MQEQVHMRIDEPRHQRRAAEVDYPGASGMIDAGSNGTDAIAFHENFSRLEDGAGVNLEKTSGMEDDGSSGLLRAGKG
jgi:hypothetical protein